MQLENAKVKAGALNPESNRIEQALRNVALGVSGARGAEVFREIVRYLAISLGVDFAFVGKLVEDSCERVRTLAVFDRGAFLANVEYNLKGTPCENVVGKRFEFIPTGAPMRFPGDPMLQNLHFDSYAAYPLFDCQGKALGLIAITDRKPLKDRGVTEALLKIFSIRAAAELERLRAEESRNVLEAQIRQAQKMEAIGHLSGGIAHDFNNILTGIMGYVVLAQERTDQLGDAKLSRYLERASQAGQRARDLIRQLLTFSRGQRGEPRPLALRPLVKEAVKLLRPTLPATVELETDLDPRLPAVMLDPVQVEQVLMNLCINARDAMDGSGRIEVGLHSICHVPAVCASCRQPVKGDFVELTVHDTGPGINPEHLDRIFEPFFTTKEAGKGSGMGLSTVHGIVHEYGAHILVDTAPGQGTTFRVLFRPLAASHQDKAPSSGSGTSILGDHESLNGHVLVVDDDDVAGDFMQDLFENWGLKVTLAPDGIEGRDRFAEDPQRYALALLDQAMPRMTGLELTRHLFALRPELPVILYTGYSDNLSDEQVKAAGIHALIRKPVDVDELFRLMSELLV